MERIGVLINKLQELYSQRASAEQILHVTQMLQTELFLAKQQQHTTDDRKKVTVIMPSNIPSKEPVADDIPEKPAPALPKEAVAEEILVQDPLVAETAVKEARKFNVLEEVPTLAHQPLAKELNETMSNQELSLNDKLSQHKKELGEVLNNEPLKDIKKAISLNDRYIFITELFRGDEAMYERSLKTINHFSIYAEAEFWIQRELKLKLGWKEDLPSVKLFDQLVQRRFRSI